LNIRAPSLVLENEKYGRQMESEKVPIMNPLEALTRSYMNSANGFMSNGVLTANTSNAINSGGVIHHSRGAIHPE